jgi:Uma2 family endonuclease
MSSAEQPSFVSVEDYLAAEELATTKSEYINGWVRAMSGANARHNTIKGNTLGLLWLRLRGKPCQAFDSDMKIRVRHEFSTQFYYPDASVVCDSNSPTETFQDHPVLLVEVLSRSTRSIDLDEKLEAYLTIVSLQAYILFEQFKPMAIVMRRTEKGFLRETAEGLSASIELPFLDIELPLSEIYDRVDFTEGTIHEQQLNYEVD